MSHSAVGNKGIPVVAHIVTRQGDTERNVYAQQLPHVLKHAEHEFNQSGTQHAHSHGGCCDHAHESDPLIKSDPNGLDYDEIYLRAMSSFEQRVLREGLKLPSEVKRPSFAQNEHLKRARTGMENLKSADHDPDLKNGDLRRRNNTEQLLAYYSRVHQHARGTLASQTKALARVMRWSPELRGAVLDLSSFQSGDFFDAQAFASWFKSAFATSITASEAKTFLENYSTFMAQALRGNTSRLNPAKQAFESLLQKAPFAKDTLRLASNWVEEQHAFADGFRNSSPTLVIKAGACQLMPIKNGFKLVQAFGQRSGKPCQYVLEATTGDDQKQTWKLSVLSADGQTVQSAETIYPQWGGVSRLKQYFSSFDVDLIFSPFSRKLDQCTFEQLAGHLKASEKLNFYFDECVSREIDREILAEVKSRNIVSIVGTGYSYNAALYGENLAVDSRPVMTGRLFELAKRGEFALHGSCGFQQNLIWNQGGNITACQDTHGKTFLADANHGNDPFTVDEKQSTQQTKPFTDRAGMYEKPVTQLVRAGVASNVWASRDVAPLSVPYIERFTDSQNVSRDLSILVNGQTVAAPEGMQLTNAEGRPVKLIRMEQLVPNTSGRATRQQFNWNLAELDANGRELSCRLLLAGESLYLVKHLETQLKDDLGRDVLDSSGQRVHEKVKLQLRWDADNHTVKVVSFSAWAKTPLPHPTDASKVLTATTGEVMCTYELLQQSAENGPLDLGQIIDHSFATINCVHTQNGLGGRYEQLGDGVEIVGSAVLAQDGVHGRNSILAGDRHYPDSHPVPVDPNTRQQHLISEALELSLGAGIVGTFNQNHSDMYKYEGGVDADGKPRKWNPYWVGDIKEDASPENYGNRQGNTQLLDRGLTLKKMRETMGDIRSAGANASEQSTLVSRLKKVDPSKINQLSRALENEARIASGKAPHADTPSLSAIEAESAGLQAQSLARNRILDVKPSGPLVPSVPVPGYEGVGTSSSPSLTLPTGSTVTAPTAIPVAADRVPASSVTPDERRQAIIQNMPAAIEAQLTHYGCVNYAKLNSSYHGEFWQAVRRALVEQQPQLLGGMDDREWNDVQERFHNVFSSPDLAEVAQLSAEAIRHQAILDLQSEFFAGLKKRLELAKREGDLTTIEAISRQLRFRHYPLNGWGIAPGAKAGLALNAIPHTLYPLFEPMAKAVELGTKIATVADSVIPFGVLLAGTGIEITKNAAYAHRRLSMMKKAYQSQVGELTKASKELLDLPKNFATIDPKKVSNPSSSIDAALKVLDSKTKVLEQRRKIIDQDLNQKIFDMSTGPLLVTASAATLVGAATSLGGVSAAAITGPIGAVALLAFGLSQTINAVRALWKTRKITREYSAKDLCVDSGVRRAFNIYHEQRLAAFKFKIANWGVFSAGSALLLGSSVATATGIGAPVAAPLGAVGGLLVAASVVTGIIDPKREWRGKTTISAEDTPHLWGDFLSTARRRNRLVNCLNGQMGAVATITAKMVDRSLTSNKPGMKKFSHRFNMLKTLRWVLPDFHRRALARAVAKHTGEVKDHQIDLMYRTNRHEINFAAFRVDEREKEVRTLNEALSLAMTSLKGGTGAGARAAMSDAQKASIQMLQKQVEQANLQLNREKTILEKLNGLQQFLDTYSVEMGREFRTTAGDNTLQQFNALRMEYLVAHDLLTDGLSRRELRNLLTLQQESGTSFIKAKVGGKMYPQEYSHANLGKMVEGKIESVVIENSPEARQWLLANLSKACPKLNMNELFARVMCSTLPARLSYEMSANMNVHMEDLRQRVIREELAAKKAESPRTGWFARAPGAADAAAAA